MFELALMQLPLNKGQGGFIINKTLHPPQKNT